MGLFAVVLLSSGEDGSEILRSFFRNLGHSRPSSTSHPPYLAHHLLRIVQARCPSRRSGVCNLFVVTGVDDVDVGVLLPLSNVFACLCLCRRCYILMLMCLFVLRFYLFLQRVRPSLVLLEEPRHEQQWLLPAQQRGHRSGVRQMQVGGEHRRTAAAAETANADDALYTMPATTTMQHYMLSKIVFVVLVWKIEPPAPLPLILVMVVVVGWFFCRCWCSTCIS